MRPFLLRRRAAALLTLTALLAAACGGDAPPDSAGSPSSSPTEQAEGGHPVTADDAPQAAPAPAQPNSVGTETSLPVVSPEVEVREPDLVIRPKEEDPGSLQTATGVDGVDHVAGASTFSGRIVVTPPPSEDAGSPNEPHPSPQTTGPREIEVEVMGIDPLAFRPLTPSVTAQEPGVWQRLLEGDVVVRHDVAQQLGLELGESYVLKGPAGEIEARIGAFASNGAPPFAEVLVPWQLGTQLGAGEVNMLVVSVEEAAPTKEVGEAVVDALGGGDFSVRSAPEQQRANLVGTGQFEFEPFSYTDLGDGMIIIDRAWVDRWIATVELPGLGTTRCHRVMIPQLVKALEEIQDAGLYGHFKPEQFGGCYMPRHIDWNPSKPLSMHAWGLAIDFNTHDNWLGQAPQMDRRIVSIFEKWGFEWGGWWSRPDGMHFELDRVIDVGG